MIHKQKNWAVAECAPRAAARSTALRAKCLLLSKFARTPGMGSRSNNMPVGADVGGRNSHAKEYTRSKTSWNRKYIRSA